MLLCAGLCRIDCQTSTMGIKALLLRFFWGTGFGASQMPTVFCNHSPLQTANKK
jgi:hypothetical protein